MNKINNVKFSIIMATYNHEEFIARAISSVLEQTYKNIELIIVNDGSTDSTDSVIRKFNDERIIYIKQENQGIDNLAKSYNKALEKCNGEYVCILEGDDYWTNNKLDIQLKNLDSDADILWSKSYYVDSRNNVTGKSNINIKKKKGKIQDLVSESFLYGNLVTPSPTVMFKKSALLKHGGFADIENVKVVDYSTTLLLLVNGSHYQFIDEYLGFYRRHDNQATQMLKSNIYKEHNIILLNIFSESFSNIDILELNNALAWNDILEKYSSGKTLYPYSYFPYLFTFNNKHKFKYLVLLLLGLIGKNKMYKIREYFRGIV